MASSAIRAAADAAEQHVINSVATAESLVTGGEAGVVQHVGQLQAAIQRARPRVSEVRDVAYRLGVGGPVAQSPLTASATAGTSLQKAQAILDKLKSAVGHLTDILDANVANGGMGAEIPELTLKETRAFCGDAAEVARRFVNRVDELT